MGAGVVAKDDLCARSQTRWLAGLVSKGAGTTHKNENSTHTSEQTNAGALECWSSGAGGRGARPRESDAAGTNDALLSRLWLFLSADGNNKSL